MLIYPFYVHSRKSLHGREGRWIRGYPLALFLNKTLQGTSTVSRVAALKQM